MTVSSTRLVPDIQYWFELFIRTSNLNKSITPFPSTLSSNYLLENKSFIRLLFDDNWPITLNEYSYMFEEATNRLSIPHDFRTRLMLYPSSGKYYNCVDSPSDTSINIFNLQPNDITLLNKLLSYRLNPTGTIITDINYSTLATHLSKLIYLFLNIKINSNYTNFDNVVILSDEENLLENCYEMYLCEILFNHISSKGT